MESKEERMQRFTAEIESARNLRPKAFALATDSEADVKARWTAFEELYESISESLIGKGSNLRDLIDLDPQSEPDEVERASRVHVAMALTMSRFGWAKEALEEAFFQAEVLAPTPPDPETGLPRITIQDQAILFAATNVMRTEMPEDWECFYKSHSEPAEKRRLAFARMYVIIGKAWLEHSLFARRLKPDQRQKWVILSFMCHVPKEQWTQSDLEQLWVDLALPRDPDWDALPGLA